MQKLLVVANWKMNPSAIGAAQRLTKAIKKGLQRVTDTEIVLCPPHTWLSAIKEELKKSKIKFGAQNSFWKESGAYTGEISVSMIKNLGCSYVIIGHSERRQILGETDEIINLKLKRALKGGLNCILCIGETLEERQEDKMAEVVTRQLQSGLKGISPFSLSRISIAYEPIWAIGSGTPPASPNEIMTAGLFIRKVLTGLYSTSVVQKLRILYGGSVAGSNAAFYIKESGMNGLLVGGASLNATEFINIVKTVSNI